MWVGCKIYKIVVKWSEVQEVKSERTVKGIYGWWSEWSEGRVKFCVLYLWSNNIRN